MTQANRPIMVFDVNETLLDITHLEPLFVRIFGNKSVLREWFSHLIIYSQTMTLSGLYAPFSRLASGTLRMIATMYDIDLKNSDIQELKERITTMPAHPDVVPALTKLHNAGFELVTLTNSAKTPSPTPLEHAGIDHFFTHNFSIDDVKKFKPAPETYQFVAKQMHATTSDLCLVACHLWDTVGAQAAGCSGALITRPHNAILPVESLPMPHFHAPTLTDVANQIIQYWSTSTAQTSP